MNEEIMENEIVETEGMDTITESENSGNGIFVKLLISTVIVGAGVAAVLYKNRAKIEERKIEKLRKKGYVIYGPEDRIPENYVPDDIDETEEGED